MTSFIDIIITIVILGGFVLLLYSGYRHQSIGDTLKHMIEWFDDVGHNPTDLANNNLNLGNLTEVMKKK